MLGWHLEICRTDERIQLPRHIRLEIRYRISTRPSTYRTFYGRLEHRLSSQSGSRSSTYFEQGSQPRRRAASLGEAEQRRGLEVNVVMALASRVFEA